MVTCFARRLGAVLLVFVASLLLCLGFAPSAAYADETGVQATNIRYTITDDGVLTIEKDDPDQESIVETGAFKDRNALVSINVGEGITQIKDSAFSGCSNVTSVSLPSSLSTMGTGVFQGCDSLTSITLPDAITVLPSNTFTDCSKLTSVTLPANLGSIGDAAFKNCMNLTSITLPSGVESIGANAFTDCKGFSSVQLNSGLKTISDSAFRNAGDGSATLIIPASVQSVGTNALMCNFKTIQMEDPSTSIALNANAFMDPNDTATISFNTLLLNTSDPGKISFSETTFQGLKNAVTVQVPGSAAWLAENSPLGGQYGNADSNINWLTSVDKPAAVTGLVYSGQPQTGVNAGLGYVLSSSTATVDAGNCVGTNAGNYPCTATPTAPASAQGHCTVKWTDGSEGAYNLDFDIAKADIDMSGVSFSDATIIYDGQPHSIVVSGIVPDGVTVSYQNNTRTDVGTQDATAHFESDNYNVPADMTAKLTITENNNGKGSDNSGTGSSASKSSSTTSSSNRGSDKSSTTAKTGDSPVPLAAAGIALLAGGALLAVSRRRKA